MAMTTSHPRPLYHLASALLAMLLGAASLLAAGQPAEPPPPIVGKIRTFADHVLTIGTPENGDVAVTLGSASRVVVNRPGTLADIATGAFIGTTAVEGPDGTLSASEVHVFPEALRGTGEGHYPWGKQPATTMTNGSVRSMTNGSVATRAPATGIAAGLTLDVAYKGGQTRVVVGPDVPVVVITPAAEDLLAPGTQVMAIGQADASGGISANLIAILPAPSK